jgi:regulatory protein
MNLKSTDNIDRDNLTEILKKFKRSCSNREYCSYQIEEKLIKLGVCSVDRFKIIEELKESQFIDNTRFLKAYIKDKHLLKKWGEKKILWNLKRLGFLENEIKKDLEELVCDNRYYNNLNKILTQKNQTYKPTLSKFEREQKLISFAISKGYNYNHIKSVLEQILTNFAKENNN